jgi:hypothetical protein
MKKVSVGLQYPSFIITLLIIILLGSYLLVYIPKKERDLQREHFRWLQRVDNNIKLKIEGADTLLSHLLEFYSNDNDTNSTKKYVDSFPKDNFILFTDFTPYNADKQPTIKPDSNGLQLYPDTTLHVGTLFGMRVYEPLQTFIVSATKTDSARNKYAVCMQYTFEKFVEPLLTGSIFDHYVIFNQGTVVYEDFPSGLSYRKEDSLVLGNKGVSGASIISQKVGGEIYKMFLQPVAFAKNTWILAGLLSEEKYNAERRELPWGFVLFLAVVALGLFLFIPLIRLFNLGNNDRLRIMDTVELFFVVNLLMSLLFFCFLRLYQDPPTKVQDFGSEDTLAKKIGTAFTTEIKARYQDLRSFDSLMSRDGMQTDLSKLGREDLNVGTLFPGRQSARDTIASSAKIKINELCNNISNPEVGWYNDDGWLQHNWTYNNNSDPPANYSYRDYFKMIKNDRPFLLDKDTFYVDQVISRVDGNFRTSISKKDSTFPKEVVALFFDIKSLDSVIMPAGYLFSIINDDGTVLYHSFKNRQLNENLSEEFSNSKELEDALHGRYAETSFITDYYEKKYAVTVRPLKGLPYFLVIMSDIGYPSSTDVETTSFTSGMTALFMLFIFADLALVVVTSSRRSYFKNGGLVKTWLWPRRSSHEQYRIISIGNIFTIFLLAIFFYKTPYLNYFLILLLSIPINTLFVNVLFALKYRKDNITYRNYKMRAITALAAVIIIINLLFIKFLTSYTLIIVFELVCFAGYATLIYSSNSIRIFLKGKRISWPQDFVDSFSLMIFTRIIFASGIPVMFFYISSFNFEQNLLARYREYDFANKLIRKFPRLDFDPSSNYIVSIKNDFSKSVYDDGRWVTDSTLTRSLNREEKPLDADDSATADMFNLFSLYNEALPSNNDNFYSSHSADSSYSYNNFFEDVLYGKQGSKIYARLKSGNYLWVGSQNLDYPKLTSFVGLEFWVLLLLCLVGFYFLVLQVVKKLFGVKVLDISEGNKLDEKLLLNTPPYKLVFAVGLPGEDKLNYVRNTLCKKSRTLDLKQILENAEKEQSDVEWWQLKYEMQKDDFKYVIIDSFEYKMSNIDLGNKKLDLMQSLISSNKNVIILSAVHPASFIAAVLKEANGVKIDDNKQSSFINVISKKLNNVKVTDNNYLATNADDYISKWHALLLPAPVIYVPVKQGATINNIRDLETNVNEKELEKDLFSIQLQLIAYNYYSSIWYSLTLDEKLILYDLAEDGLVNTYNSFAFNSLSSKGLIVRANGLLHIFSNSFRNFILTGIGDQEKTRLKKQFEESGAWSKLKAPLVFVIIAILVFIVASQQAVFTKAIGYISLFATSIPALVQLLSSRINKPDNKSLKGATSG